MKDAIRDFIEKHQYDKGPETRKCCKVISWGVGDVSMRDVNLAVAVNGTERISSIIFLFLFVISVLGSIINYNVMTELHASKSIQVSIGFRFSIHLLLIFFINFADK